MELPDSVLLMALAIALVFVLVLGLMAVFVGLRPRVAWLVVKPLLAICLAMAALSFAVALFPRTPETVIRLFHAGALATVTSLEALLFCLLLRRNGMHLKPRTTLLMSDLSRFVPNNV